MKTVTFSKDVTRFTIDPAVKAQWIEALRSGNYMQCRSRLKRTVNYDTCFCCLGVLCVLHGQNQNPPVDFENLNGIWYYPQDADNKKSSTMLPSEWVEKWAGRKADDTDDDLMAHVIKQDGSELSMHIGQPWALLPMLNDTFHYTFEEIADFIEKHM